MEHRFDEQSGEACVCVCVCASASVCACMTGEAGEVKGKPVNIK